MHYTNIDIMFLVLKKSRTGTNVQVYFAESYRENGKVRQRLVKRIGELTELQKQDKDIIQKLKLELKQITQDKRQHLIEMILDLNARNTNEKSLNFGYLYLDGLYRSLNIDKIINDYSKLHKFSYDLNEIFKLLIYNRILNPTSKKGALETKDDYCIGFDIKEDSPYRALDHLNNLKDDLLVHLHKQITQKYNRDVFLVFYDVTNFYFETETQDNLRRKGYSKENRKSPIVQMGLFMDNNSVPICYKLFSGNTPDSKTLIDFIDTTKKQLGFEKVVVVADKAMNSKENIAELNKKGYGWLFSQQLRGNIDKNIVEFGLDQKGYKKTKDESGTVVHKYKSTLNSRILKDKTQIQEKVLIKWSKKYELRQRAKRQELIDIAADLKDDLTRYSSLNKKGPKRYITETLVDKSTGEIDRQRILSLDTNRIAKEELLDGYYAIVTSEVDLDDQEIMNRYSDLWKIEDSFRIYKSDLKTRPVFVYKKEHIESHFLICFVALTIMRLLGLNSKNQYSIKALRDSLNSMTMTHIEKQIYIFNKDMISNELEQCFKLDFNKKYFSSTEIKTAANSIYKSITALQNK